jgi:hypothetical protein
MTYGKRSNMKTISALAALTLGILLCPALGGAADTTEPFAPGISDIEVYMAHDGMGRGSADQSIENEFVLGVGLTSRFSAYIHSIHASSTYLTRGSQAFGFGLYGTALESDHLDVDLFLGLCTVDGQDDLMSLTPALELNWDSAANMSTWGLYTRMCSAFYGHEHQNQSRRLTDIGVTLGGYATLRPGHQLLLEYEALRGDRILSDLGWEHDSLSLGYNFGIAGNMEMISQVTMSLPQGEHESAYGLKIGFISTFSDGQ